MAGKCCCKCKIGPSILNADLSCLADECNKLLGCGADYLHLDVMDGHFVPNLTFGAPLVKCLRKKVPTAFFDMHMMVANPEKWVVDMADAGANQYTFHLEATDKPMELIGQIKKAGMKVLTEIVFNLLQVKFDFRRSLQDRWFAFTQVGIGIKPGTPVESVLPFVAHVDMVLVMTVEPGFGGQKFMENMMPKVKLLRYKYKSLDIEVDGGVGISTIESAAQAGANMIVSGSAVIKSDNPKEVMATLKATTEKWIKINSETSL